MTRAKTQGGGSGKIPRASTHGGAKPKRASTNASLFNDLEAAIDALDQSSTRNAGKPTEPPANKRTVPGPTPGATPRTTPPKPPPGAERAAAIRARAVNHVDEEIEKPTTRVPPRPPPPRVNPKIPEPPKRELDADGLPRITPPPGARFPIPPAARTPAPAPRAATYDLDESAARLIAEAEVPRPEPFDFEESGVRHAEPDQAPSFDDDESAAARAIDALDASASRIPASPTPDTGLSIDIDLEESKPAAAAYQPPRAISVAESAALDVAVDGHAIEPLAIAILDEPPYVAAAKQAISVAGHKVAAAASGQAGIEQLKSLLRSGSADVVLVGLPGGEALIDTALALAPRRPVVIAAMAGKPVDAVRKAIGVGADLAVTRPIDADKLAPVLLAASRLCAERDAAGAKGSGGLDALADHEPGTLQPFESFQRVVELEIKRSKRHGYPIAIALFSVGVDSDEPPPPGVQGILRARAGNALIHTIRDIDLATELGSDQFLVLLPYTTIGGAAEVARRILHAVSSGNPLNAAGKTFAPSITGAVAGAKTGEPMSFTRLMRDASQALEEARADGAELAVPMGTPE